MVILCITTGMGTPVQVQSTPLLIHPMIFAECLVVAMRSGRGGKNKLNDEIRMLVINPGQRILGHGLDPSSLTTTLSLVRIIVSDSANK